MPEFYRISFDEDELEALRRACTLEAGREDRRLGEATSGSLEEVVDQKQKADDMQLIRGTVSIFKPGQAILITKEDLGLMRKCLEGSKKSAAADRARNKIDAAKQATPF